MGHLGFGWMLSSWCYTHVIVQRNPEEANLLLQKDVKRIRLITIAIDRVQENQAAIYPTVDRTVSLLEHVIPRCRDVYTITVSTTWLLVSACMLSQVAFGMLPVSICIRAERSYQ